MSEFRQNLELDLRTSMENSWISSAGCSHYLCLVGDCDSGAVHIHSTFGVSPCLIYIYRVDSGYGLTGYGGYAFVTSYTTLTVYYCNCSNLTLFNLY